MVNRFDFLDADLTLPLVQDIDLNKFLPGAGAAVSPGDVHLQLYVRLEPFEEKFHVNAFISQ